MNKRKQRKAEFKASIIWKDRIRTFLGLPFSFTRYILTPERLIISKGFINKKEDEVRLYRIMDISLSRTFGQRLLGIGTIHCCSGDRTMQDFDLVNIKHPKDVRELLSNAIEQERINKRVTQREFLGHDDHEHDENSDFHGHDMFDFDDEHDFDHH